MANKVVTIVVDDRSIIYGNLNALITERRDEFVSVSIQDEEEDPLLPNHLVSTDWYRRNWGLNDRDAHDLVHSFSPPITPKVIYNRLTRGELVADRELDDRLRIVFEHIKAGQAPVGIYT